MAPLDGSSTAECALEHVKAISVGCRVPEVILLRVVEPAYSISDALSEGAVMYAELTDQMQKEAEDYLAEISKKLALQSGINSKYILKYGNAANEILEYANGNQVDLIIMSSHGRSGISRWLLGSVADRVSHYAKVPVLIVNASACFSDNIVTEIPNK